MHCEKRNSCRNYLLTYSQANLQKFADNKAFSNVALNTFKNSSKSKASVTQWSVSLEDHSSGGKHFFMALKLSSSCRGRAIFEYLGIENDITVNFSSNNSG